MTKKILLSTIAASMLTTSAFATYGTNLVGFGTKARGMGGASVAAFNGAESAVDNPAMIAGAEEAIAGSLLYFMPDVSVTDATTASTSSAADTFIIPNVAYVKPLSKELTLGVTFYGASGLGVDYSSNATYLGGLETALSIAKLGIPIAYKVNDALSVGITPVVAYGSLEINAAGGLANSATSSVFTYELGAAYKVTKELNVALVHKAKAAHKYDGVISAATVAFGMPAGAMGDDLAQPAETALGISYKMGASTINVDYRTVAWSDAEGYADFGWQDQAITSIGYEYATTDWAARVGYSMADQSPLTEATAATAGSYAGLLNTFNGVGFPATITSHITFGGSYNLDKKMTIDAAYVMASEDSFAPASTMMLESGVKHTQTSLQVGVAYKF